MSEANGQAAPASPISAQPAVTISLHIDLPTAHIVLTTLRTGQRTYGRGTVFYDRCRAVADVLEAEIRIVEEEAAAGDPNYL